MTADKIDDDIKVLLVIHPKEITDTGAIRDRSVHHARRQADRLPRSPPRWWTAAAQNPMMQMPGGGSSLENC